MAIRSQEEALSLIKALIGDRSDDDTLAALEDLTDTLNSRFSQEETDWKAKYEENDAAWRARYRDRFFSASRDGSSGGADTTETLLVTTDEEIDVPDEKSYTYDELFKEG